MLFSDLIAFIEERNPIEVPAMTYNDLMVLMGAPTLSSLDLAIIETNKLVEKYADLSDYMKNKMIRDSRRNHEYYSAR